MEKCSGGKSLLDNCPGGNFMKHNFTGGGGGGGNCPEGAIEG